MTPLGTQLLTELVTDGMNREVCCVDLARAKSLSTKSWEIKTSGECEMWLLGAADADGVHWDFALLDFVSSDEDRKGIVCEIVFTACGPRGGLNELRHMNWSPVSECGSGYLNYPNLLGVADALRIMHEWMDAGTHEDDCEWNP